MTQVFPAKYEIVDNTGAVLVPEFSAYFDGSVLLEYPTGTPVIIPAGGILRDSCCAKADLCSILSIEIDETTNENVFLVGTCEWGRTPIGGAKVDPVLNVLKTEFSTAPVGGYAEGDIIEYQVIIENVGTAPALNVVFSDTLSPITSTFDPQNLVNGGSVNIADGSDYILRYEYIVTSDDQVNGELTNTATVSGDNTLSPSQNSAIVNNFAPWSVQETFDPGTFTGTSSFEGSLGTWVLGGSVDTVTNGAGYVGIGGDIIATSPIINLPSGLNTVDISYDVREVGALEAGDFYGLLYRLDGGSWIDVFPQHNNDGSEIGTLSGVNVLGSTTLEFQAYASLNASGGQSGGGAEQIHLYDITVTEI